MLNGLRLNERGCAILVDCILLWLLQDNFTKANAVKRARERIRQIKIGI
jgi:hypothetical protein